MPNFACTLFFAQKKYGFTETYWRTGSNNDPKSYSPDVEALINKRAPLLGLQSSVFAYRIALEGGTRTYFVFHYPGDGITTQTQEKSDFVNSRLLVQMANAGNTKHKNLYLGAIWDSVNIDGGTYVPSPLWLGYWNQFVTELKTKGWGWQSVANKVVRAVNGVTANVNGTVTVTTAAGLFPGPFPQEVEVRIAKVQGATQINGVQLATAADDHTFTTQKRIAIFPYLTDGRVTYSGQSVVTIADVFAQRIVERKAGNASYRSVGRRAG